MLQHARPLPDREPYPRPMFDSVGEQLSSLLKIITRVKKALDIHAVLGPLFELVKVAIVRGG
jgi:hypothetical protein